MQRMTEFGTMLTSARLSAGYSQREVAEYTHVSRSTYGHMELCLRKPSAEFVLRISALYRKNPLLFLEALIPKDMYDENASYVQYLSELRTSMPESVPSRRKRRRKSACKPKN